MAFALEPSPVRSTVRPRSMVQDWRRVHAETGSPFDRTVTSHESVDPPGGHARVVSAPSPVAFSGAGAHRPVTAARPDPRVYLTRHSGFGGAASTVHRSMTDLLAARPSTSTAALARSATAASMLLGSSGGRGGGGGGGGGAAAAAAAAGGLGVSGVSLHSPMKLGGGGASTGDLGFAAGGAGGPPFSGAKSYVPAPASLRDVSPCCCHITTTHCHTWKLQAPPQPAQHGAAPVLRARRPAVHH